MLSVCGELVMPWVGAGRVGTGVGVVMPWAWIGIQPCVGGGAAAALRGTPGRLQLLSGSLGLLPLQLELHLEEEEEQERREVGGFRRGRRVQER